MEEAQRGWVVNIGQSITIDFACGRRGADVLLVNLTIQNNKLLQRGIKELSQLRKVHLYRRQAATLALLRASKELAKLDYLQIHAANAKQWEQRHQHYTNVTLKYPIFDKVYRNTADRLGSPEETKVAVASLILNSFIQFCTLRVGYIPNSAAQNSFIQVPETRAFEDAWSEIPERSFSGMLFDGSDDDWDGPSSQKIVARLKRKLGYGDSPRD
jgi:hypothetical protein